jgi:hypothetical protein
MTQVRAKKVEPKCITKGHWNNHVLKPPLITRIMLEKERDGKPKNKKGKKLKRVFTCNDGAFQNRSDLSFVQVTNTLYL